MSKKVVTRRQRRAAEALLKVKENGTALIDGADKPGCSKACCKRSIKLSASCPRCSSSTKSEISARLFGAPKTAKQKIQKDAVKEVPVVKRQAANITNNPANLPELGNKMSSVMISSAEVLNGIEPINMKTIKEKADKLIAVLEKHNSSTPMEQIQHIRAIMAVDDTFTQSEIANLERILAHTQTIENATGSSEQNSEVKEREYDLAIKSCIRSAKYLSQSAKMILEDKLRKTNPQIAKESLLPKRLRNCGKRTKFVFPPKKATVNETSSEVQLEYFQDLESTVMPTFLSLPLPKRTYPEVEVKSTNVLYEKKKPKLLFSKKERAAQISVSKKTKIAPINSEDEEEAEANPYSISKFYILSVTNDQNIAHKAVDQLEALKKNRDKILQQMFEKRAKLGVVQSYRRKCYEKYNKQTNDIGNH